MNMSEVRKLKVEPQLSAAIIDLQYAHQHMVDMAEDLKMDLVECRKSARNFKKRLDKACAQYKEIYGVERKLVKIK